MSESTADSVSLLVRPEIRAEKPYLVKGARDVAVKLNQNESPFDLPGPIKRELLQSFFQIPFNRYPREQPFSLVAALSRMENHPEDGILVGNGSNELTHSLGLSFVSPGSPVVLPRPMFALFESVVRMHGGKVLPVAPLANLHFDTETLLNRVREHSPVMTVLATPNNPTGKSMTIDEIRQVCSASSGVVVVDEAYQEFNLEISATSLFSDYPNLIVMRTLSKAFGLAGVRIGYMLGNPVLVREIFKSRLPFMVSRFSEMTALAVLNNKDLVRDHVISIKKSIISLYLRLEQIDGVSVVSSQTNFLLFKTGIESSLLTDRLAERGILVRNMAGYPELKGYLRVTAGTEAENNAFVEALKLVIEEF